MNIDSPPPRLQGLVTSLIADFIFFVWGPHALWHFHNVYPEVRPEWDVNGYYIGAGSSKLQKGDEAEDSANGPALHVRVAPV